MSNDIFIDFARQAGWQTRKVGGETTLTMDLDGRVLRSYITLSKTLTKWVWRDESNLWTPGYAHVCAYIMQSDPSNLSLVRRKNSRFETEQDLSFEFVSESTDALINWAQSIDIDAELKGLAEPKAKHGLRSHNHLAALATLGRVSDVQAFADEFAATGAAAGLHAKMIKADMVQRALAFAQDIAAGNSLETVLEKYTT